MIQSVPVNHGQPPPYLPATSSAQHRLNRWNRSVTVSRKRKGRSSATKEQLRCLCYFEVRPRTEKYAVPYFFFESEAPAKRPQAQECEAVEDLNVQVIRSYSWAAAESQKNSQCKPVNNCGGSRDFPETLVSSLERWQPATDCAADLLRMDLNDLSRRSSLQLIEQAGHASG